MNDLTPFPAQGGTLPQNASTTPAGIQSTAELRKRRWIVVALNVVTWWLLNSAAWAILGSGGWTIVDIVLALCFAIATPWTVLGFWNALIGLWLLHRGGDAMAEVAPFAAAGDLDTPLSVRTAVFMTLRNEDPERAIARLKIVKDSIDRTPSSTISSCRIPTVPTSPTRRSARRPPLRRKRAATGSSIGGASTIPASRPAMSAISSTAGAPATS
jgi:membrane glycosyltransferase